MAALVYCLRMRGKSLGIWMGWLGCRDPRLVMVRPLQLRESATLLETLPLPGNQVDTRDKWKAIIRDRDTGRRLGNGEL